MTNANWIKDAPCALPVPTDDSEEPRRIDFYSSNRDEQERAKAICIECPVRLMCLQTALNNRERWGIHGGVDERELRRVQAINELGESHVSKRGPVRCPNCGPYSTRFLTPIEKKRTRTHVKCSNCGIDWIVRKGINVRKPNW